MEHSLEVSNVKTEPTDSTSNDQLEIPNEMLVDVKQENECVLQSEIDIKIEPREDGNKFLIIAGTSNGLYPNYDMRFETKEPLIKIEYDNVLDKLLPDPLDIGDAIKVEEQFSTNMDHGESRIKIEPSEKENEVNNSETEVDFDLHRSASNLQDQLLNRNDPDCKDKKYICNECNKTFRWNGDLERHVRTHTGEKPYTCDVCKNSFSQKGTLDRHMLIHSGKKTHSCNVCKKVFSRKGNLDSHKKIHSSVTLFSCKECDRPFKHKNSLVAHERTHTGDKPYTCDLCDKAFTQKTALNTHRRTHTGEKPFSCDLCNKSFTDRSSFSRHKKIHKN